MAEDGQRRAVSLVRVGPSRFRASNFRGGELEIAGGDDSSFTPVELLLAAMGACSGIDVDTITRRRAEPTSFSIQVSADKVRDDDGNHLQDVLTTFTVRFPEADAGDAAREALPDAVRRSEDWLCTVTRTVALPTRVSSVVAD